MEAIEDGGPAGLPPDAKAVIVSSVITAAISGLVVGLRFFARLWPASLVGNEDWAILVSWWAYYTIIFYNFGLTGVKISILLLYLRVLRDLSYRKACYYVLSFVVVVSLWMIISSILFCIPIRKNWDHNVPGRCIDAGAHWFTNAGLNIATDFMILILPVPILPKVKLARRQKISLWLIFALGFFICIVSIMRIPSLIRSHNSLDTTMDAPSIAQWSVIEINTAIVCASLITLKPLVTRYFPSLLDSTPCGGPDDFPESDQTVPGTVGSKDTNMNTIHPRDLLDDTVFELRHESFEIRPPSCNESVRLSLGEVPDSEHGTKVLPVEIQVSRM
ncbi:hypothetical protein CCHL11_02412 [Colletotrichum chlorophyti]|uniref:Rhodopsin domain-containing protein n=1 Tax=Colletotrichum chlorophyti TaxID=708187 RepID=A0A1Q8S628_9PEZI|nr:hypothetical protein CCHL11_02412 [Colletotrichum chlorophyti]